MVSGARRCQRALERLDQHRLGRGVVVPPGCGPRRVWSCWSRLCVSQSSSLRGDAAPLPYAPACGHADPCLSAARPVARL